MWQKFTNVSEEHYLHPCSWREISSKCRRISTRSRRPILEDTHTHRREHLKSHVILCVHTVSEISRRVLKAIKVTTRCCLSRTKPFMADLNISLARTVWSVWRLGDGLDVQGILVRFPAEVRDLSLLQSIQTGFWAHLASYPVGTKGSFSEAKLPGCEADYPFPLCAEVKNDRISISTPPFIHDKHSHKQLCHCLEPNR